MTKGFKIQKILANTNESTPAFETLQEAREFLANEVNEYSNVSSIALTTRTPDKLVWTQTNDGRESIIIQVIDTTKQANNAPQQYLEIAQQIDNFYKYMKDTINSKEIALTYSYDWDDIEDKLIDCCYLMNELSEYVKGEY